MKLGWIMLPFAAGALTCANACRADEAALGLFAHDVPWMGDRVHEKGEDLVATWASDPMSIPLVLGKPSVYVTGGLNLQGKTDFAAAGLRWKFDLGKRLYVQPGIGMAVNDAPLRQEPGRIWAGSHFAFEPEASIGWRFTPRVSVEATVMHMSHAYLFAGRNPGLNEIGLRTVVKFDRASLFHQLAKLGGAS
jgi:lipid A 3-O-deacylase